MVLFRRFSCSFSSSFWRQRVVKQWKVTEHCFSSGTDGAALYVLQAETNVKIEWWERKDKLRQGTLFPYVSVTKTFFRAILKKVFETETLVNKVPCLNLCIPTIHFTRMHVKECPLALIFWLRKAFFSSRLIHSSQFPIIKGDQGFIICDNSYWILC